MALNTFETFRHGDEIVSRRTGEAENREEFVTVVEVEEEEEKVVVVVAMATMVLVLVVVMVVVLVVVWTRVSFARRTRSEVKKSSVYAHSRTILSFTQSHIHTQASFTSASEEKSPRSRTPSHRSDFADGARSCCCNVLTFVDATCIDLQLASALMSVHVQCVLYTHAHTHAVITRWKRKLALPL